MMQAIIVRQVSQYKLHAPQQLTAMHNKVSVWRVSQVIIVVRLQQRLQSVPLAHTQLPVLQNVLSVQKAITVR